MKLQMTDYGLPLGELEAIRVTILEKWRQADGSKPTSEKEIAEVAMLTLAIQACREHISDIDLGRHGLSKTEPHP